MTTPSPTHERRSCDSAQIRKLTKQSLTDPTTRGHEMKTRHLAAVLLLAALSTLACFLPSPRAVANAVTPGTADSTIEGIVCEVAEEVLTSAGPGAVVTGAMIKIAKVGNQRDLEDVCLNAIEVFISKVRERDFAQLMRAVAGQQVRASGWYEAVEGMRFTARSFNLGPR